MKRYQVCLFPSLLGTPWQTDTKAMAYVLAALRFIIGLGVEEIRVIDVQTAKHIIVW